MRKKFMNENRLFSMSKKELVTLIMLMDKGGKTIPNSNREGMIQNIDSKINLDSHITISEDYSSRTISLYINYTISFNTNNDNIKIIEKGVCKSGSSYIDEGIYNYNRDKNAYEYNRDYYFNIDHQEKNKIKQIGLRSFIINNTTFKNKINKKLNSIDGFKTIGKLKCLY